VAALVASAPSAFAQGETVESTPPNQASFQQLIRDAVVAPHIESRDADGVWVRSGATRARFEPSQTTLQPVFGPNSPRDWGIEIGEARATLGGRPLSVPQAGPRDLRAGDHSVSLGGSAFREVWHLREEGLEQTFVFDRLPRGGDLQLQFAVSTDLTPVALGDSLEFHAQGLGFVSVGGAFVYDAAGHREGVTRTWIDGTIEITVPARFVETATLPMTIDPIWGTFSNSGPADDAYPDVAFCGVSQEYFLVWEDRISASSSSPLAMKVSADLTARSAVRSVAPSTNAWTAPRVAYSYGEDRVLIVSGTGVGTGSARVEGRYFDVSSFQAVGAAPFTISTTGSTDKTSVDVGGSNYPASGSSRFTVVWARQVSASDSDVQYRIYGENGTPISAVRTADSTGANDIQPTISSGLGDVSLFGDNWHIAWVRDNDLDGLGQIYAKRLHFTGNTNSDSGLILVDPASMNAHPSISSLFNEEDTASGVRPALLVYERHLTDVTRPNGLQSDLYGRWVVDDTTFGLVNITSMEDYDSALLQTRPQIVTTGEAFIITYLEEDENAINQGLTNVYMTAGQFLKGTSGPRVALAERHVPLATGAASETAVRLASRWAGETLSTATEAMAVWSRDLQAGLGDFGQLDGAGLTYILTPQSSFQFVGEQYGNANPNSLGNRNSGWLRVLGNQLINTPHLAQATDLPPNSFGYLLSSLSAGNSNLPGGSQGRLLLGGSIGRHVNDIQVSDAQGRINVVINPASIPQPNGSVSAVAGQYWRFQIWHRDSVGGQPTSNFTNGCRVQFLN
jgi:hypothetical protein